MTAAHEDYEGCSATPIFPSWPPQPPEEPAFGACVDFSKFNEARHKDYRSDTFKPSNGRKKTFNTARLIDNHRGQPETRDLLKNIEDGFTSSMRDLGLEIISDFREELQVSVSTLRKEVTDALEAHTGTKTKPANVTLVEIMEKVTDIQQRAERPATVDWTTGLVTVRDEIRKAEARQSENQTELTKLLGRLQNQCEHGVLVQIREEIRAAQLGADVAEVIQRGEAQFEQVIKEQHVMTSEVQKLQQTQLDKIEAHLSDQRQDQANRADQMFAAFSNAQENRHLGFDDLHTEISKVKHAVSRVFAKEQEEMAKIEQALNLEYDQEIDPGGQVVSLHSGRLSVGRCNADGHLSVDDDMPSLPSGHSLRRVRDYYSQTEAPLSSDASAQTVSNDMEITKSRKHRRSSAGTASVKPFAHRFADGVMKKASAQDNMKKPKVVFADAEAMKQQARKALIKLQVHISDYYLDKGWCQSVARSWAFENVTFLVIILNAFWIAVDTDNNDATLIVNAEPIFIVVENLFCCYFTAEVVIRLRAFRYKRHCVKDPWFLFDAALVALMIIETWVITIIILAVGPEGNGPEVIDIWILRMIRMVKMCRISRMARVMRAIPELVILVKGIGAASRSVLVFFSLWLIIIYVFAVVFRQCTSGFDIGVSHFDSVPDAMNTLLLSGIMPENARLVNDLAGAHAMFWPPIVFFIVLVSLILGYMLIGVLVEVIRSVASTEKEKLIVGHLAQNLRDVMHSTGRDLDEPFTRSSFRNLCVDSQVAPTLAAFGVSVVVLVDMTDVIFDDLDPDGNGLTFEAFVDVVLNMRGANPATVKDVKEQMRVMKAMVSDSESNIAKALDGHFSKFCLEIQEVRQAITHMAEVVADDDSSSCLDGSSLEGEEDDSPGTAEMSNPPELPGATLM